MSNPNKIKSFWLLSGITEFPAALNQSELRVLDEERDGAPEKIWLGLEIGVKDGNVIALFHVAVLHAFLESPCFVSLAVVSYLVLYVYTFACPSLAF